MALAAVEPSVPAPIETPVMRAPLSTRWPLSRPLRRVSWNGPRTFTFVALGVDQRNDREIPRTDTIMIGKVDLASAARQPDLDPA